MPMLPWLWTLPPCVPPPAERLSTWRSGVPVGRIPRKTRSNRVHHELGKDATSTPARMPCRMSIAEPETGRPSRNKARATRATLRRRIPFSRDPVGSRDRRGACHGFRIHRPGFRWPGRGCSVPTKRQLMLRGCCQCEETGALLCFCLCRHRCLLVGMRDFVTSIGARYLGRQWRVGDHSGGYPYPWASKRRTPLPVARLSLGFAAAMIALPIVGGGMT